MLIMGCNFHTQGETETYTYVPTLTRLQSYTAKLNTTTLYNFNIGTFAPNGGWRRLNAQGCFGRVDHP